MKHFLKLLVILFFFGYSHHIYSERINKYGLYYSVGLAPVNKINITPDSFLSVSIKTGLKFNANMIGIEGNYYFHDGRGYNLYFISAGLMYGYSLPITTKIYFQPSICLGYGVVSLLPARPNLNINTINELGIYAAIRPKLKYNIFQNDRNALSLGFYIQAIYHYMINTENIYSFGSGLMLNYLFEL
jgi:hypothetical protein